MKKVNIIRVEDAVRNLLHALREDVNREGLKDTPKRVAKYWAELLKGEDYTNEEIASMYRKDFSVSYAGI